MPPIPGVRPFVSFLSCVFYSIDTTTYTTVLLSVKFLLWVVFCCVIRTRYAGISFAFFLGSIAGEDLFSLFSSVSQQHAVCDHRRCTSLQDEESAHGHTDACVLPMMTLLMGRNDRFNVRTPHTIMIYNNGINLKPFCSPLTAGGKNSGTINNLCHGTRYMYVCVYI